MDTPKWNKATDGIGLAGGSRDVIWRVAGEKEIGGRHHPRTRIVDGFLAHARNGERFEGADLEPIAIGEIARPLTSNPYADLHPEDLDGLDIEEQTPQWQFSGRY